MFRGLWTAVGHALNLKSFEVIYGRTCEANRIPSPASRAVHSNTSVAGCFAACSRSVLWRTLGAIHSIGPGSVLVTPQIHITAFPGNSLHPTSNYVQ